jgi:hypothetical protein
MSRSSKATYRTSLAEDAALGFAQIQSPGCMGGVGAAHNAIELYRYGAVQWPV